MINPRKIYKYVCTHIGAPQYVRQTLTTMKGEVNSNTVEVWDIYTPLTPIINQTEN